MGRKPHLTVKITDKRYPNREPASVTYCLQYDSADGLAEYVVEVVITDETWWQRMSEYAHQEDSKPGAIKGF